MTTRQQRAVRQEADEFNARHPVGTAVRYWTFERKGEGKISCTRTPAEVLSGHTAVVWVKGEPGCVALSHVEPTQEGGGK